MIFHYRIADLKIEVESDSLPILDRLDQYQAEHNDQIDVRITLKSQERIQIPPGKRIADQSFYWVKNPPPREGYQIFTTENEGERVLTLADMNKEWNAASIHYLNYLGKRAWENYEIQTAVYSHLVMGLLFRYSLLFHRGIVVHASTIQWNGKAIMFSAPSGTGKSTHVRLWQQALGNDIKVLNDDTPAVRFAGNHGPRVYGTPWCGSSNMHCNDSAPLGAIVLLQQAPENSLQRLNRQQAAAMLMPRSFLPYFDRHMLSLACDTLEAMISSVPVYLLKCLPNQEAMEMVYQCLI